MELYDPTCLPQINLSQQLWSLLCIYPLQNTVLYRYVRLELGMIGYF